MILAPAPPVAHVAATTTIRLVDNRFQPSKKTVKRGTTVRFLWTGKNDHNVTAFDGPSTFHSTTKTHGSYRKRLTKRGTYLITCTVHANMSLTLRVR